MSLIYWTSSAVASFVSWGWENATVVLLSICIVLLFKYGIRRPNEPILSDWYSRQVYFRRALNLMNNDLLIHALAFVLSVILGISFLNWADLRLDARIRADVDIVSAAVERRMVERVDGRLKYLFGKLERVYVELTSVHPSSEPGTGESASGEAEESETEGSTKSDEIIFRQSKTKRENGEDDWKAFVTVLANLSENASLVEQIQSLESKQGDEKVATQDKQDIQKVFEAIGLRLDIDWPKHIETEGESENSPPKINIKELAKKNPVVRLIIETFGTFDEKGGNKNISPDELADIRVFFHFNKLKEARKFYKKKFASSANILESTFGKAGLSGVLQDAYSPLSVVHFGDLDEVLLEDKKKTDIFLDGQPVEFSLSGLEITNTASITDDACINDPAVFHGNLFYILRLGGQGSVKFLDSPSRPVSEKLAESLQSLKAPVELVSTDGKLFVKDEDLGWQVWHSETGSLVVPCAQCDGLGTVRDKICEACQGGKIRSLQIRDKEAWKGIYQRLGANYSNPTGRMVLNALISQAAERLDAQEVITMLTIAFASDSDLKTPATNGGEMKSFKFVAPEIYQVRITESNFNEKSLEILLDRIEVGINERIDERSGSTPFTLGITWTTLRTMIRGPIQLVTFVFFFWGSLILFFRGYVSGLFAQWSYLNRMSLLGRNTDRHHARWRDIWIGQHVITSQAPITRQVIGATRRAGDLLPFVLRNLFIALSGGTDSVKATDVIDESAEKWRKERKSEYVFLDFVAWILPSIGFLGTVIGLGQGLSLANKIVSPDQAIQAQSISNMTTQLGTAFYTTLVALTCVIPFTFFRYLLERLQRGTIRYYQHQLRRFLFSHLSWSLTVESETYKEQTIRDQNDWKTTPCTASQRDAMLFGEALRSITRYSLLGVAEEVKPLVELGILPRKTVWIEESESLRFLLEATETVSSQQWESGARSLFAYSHFYLWIQTLPKYFRRLGHVLLVLEERPMKWYLRKYGLDLAKFETGLLHVRVCSHAPDDLAAIRESAPRQADMVEEITLHGNRITYRTVTRDWGFSTSTIESLVQKGILEKYYPSTATTYSFPQLHRLVCDFGNQQIGHLEVPTTWNELSQELIGNESLGTKEFRYQDVFTGEADESTKKAVEEFLNADKRPLARSIRYLCLALPKERGYHNSRHRIFASLNYLKNVVWRALIWLFHLIHRLCRRILDRPQKDENKRDQSP